MPFDEDSITRSIVARYKSMYDGVSSSNGIIFDEEQNFDPAASREWVSLYVDNFHGVQRRRVSADEVSFDILVDIWVRMPASNIYRHMELADSICELFDQSDFAVREYDDSGSPQVGWIRLQEAQVRDYSAQTNESVQNAAMHIVITIHGVAMAT